MPSSDKQLKRLREALDALVAQDIPELLSEARREAHSRVRELLTEAMADSMLEQARHHLDTAPSPGRAPAIDPVASPAPAGARPPSRTGEPAHSADDGVLGYYVYGVAAADGSASPTAMPGVDPDHPVTTLAVDELEAVVSRVPLTEYDEQSLREHLGDIAWVERIARRHEEVLETSAALRTVIPMRLCSIYRDASGVREMLRRESELMHDALRLLHARSEWGVKVFSLPHRPSVAPSSGDHQAESGSAYLEQQSQARRRRETADDEAAAACASIHDRLSAIAAQAQVIAPQRPEVTGHEGAMLLNGVYLVDDAALASFHDAVTSLQAELSASGIELQATGPWPAYNFVPDAIGVPG
ncbi:MAG: GvpL/GvpF family gas vesicle protein [Solirubrobacteraceae bacterium]